MKLIGVFFAIGLIGCSGSATNNIVASGGSAGASGEAGANTGGEAGTSSGGSAGTINTGGSGTGGSTSTGGVAGQAGMPATGGVAGSNTGGTGGTCIPKTCLTLSMDLTGTPDSVCGIVSDGCGNYIDCGTTCANKRFLCEQGPPTTDGKTTFGTKNRCGGGCTFVPSTYCINTGATYPYVCTTQDTTLKPAEGTGCAFSQFLANGLSVWCCTGQA